MVGLLRDDKKNCNSIYELAIESPNVQLWAIGRAHRDFIVNKESRIHFKLWESIYSEGDF